MDNIREAVEAGQVPGAVFIARDLTGKVDIRESYGVRSLKNEDPRLRPAMTDDTVMWMASCTKLVTTVLLLQCVERGIMSLEDPVKNYLPQIESLQILTGYNADGAAQYKAPETQITIKHLVTNSSGLCYAAMVPDVTRWAVEHNLPIDGTHMTFEESCIIPLVFEPGTDWIYGVGVDWVGKCIEVATGQDLETLMMQNVCKPLGIKDMAFKLQQRPDMLARRGDIALRDPATGSLTYQDKWYWHKDRADCGGGSGAYMTPRDFFEVLFSLLADDGKLLKTESRRWLFEPAVSPASEAAVNKLRPEMDRFDVLGPISLDKVKKSFSIGGVLVLEDVDSKKGRRAGSVSWSGMPNQFWTIDPEAGVCMLAAFHMDFWGDKQCFDLERTFAAEVYSGACQTG